MGRAGREPALVWVVAGAPGAGKTTVAKLLIRSLLDAGRQAPALLDKDTLFGGFVAATLEAAGRAPGEREGDWYDANVKVHEYGGLTAAAREIAGLGCPVVLCGPFTGQIREPAAWVRWTAELGGGPVRLVYVRSDARTLMERLDDRASARDAGKRAGFEAFLERMQPDVPPPVPHDEIDNRRSAEPLDDQVRRVLEGL